MYPQVSMQYSLYYINNNIKEIFAIFQRFPKIFKNSLKTVRSSYEHSDHFPKISEHDQGFPKITKGCQIFPSNLQRCFDCIDEINLVCRTIKLASTYDIIDMLKISNFYSHMKISCFHSTRNPRNSLKCILIYYSTIMSFYHVRTNERAKYESVLHCRIPVSNYLLNKTVKITGK